MSGFWLNLASFLGILILAIPVLSLDRRKGRLAREKEAARQIAEDDFTAELLPHLIDLLKKDIDDWRPLDRSCLFAGYLLLLGAAFLRLFLPA